MRAYFRLRNCLRPAFVSLLAVAVALAAAARPAAACGCFAPPDPSTPVVQAGERILFAASGNSITAIIQIQYAGDAKDFGWLLPLPSLPTLEVSSDEVFATLAARTAPSFTTRVTADLSNCYRHGGGGASDLGAVFGDVDGGADNGGGPQDPLVVQGSVGPYDFAVLKADDKTAMLDWLAKNRYFVPVGTNDVVGPYIHPGAYFLALKLQSGKSAGDLQPVVVRYDSDLPMIPITLTSVTANPGMNVWVWVLGDGRAIPRNYYHAVIDDAALRWSYDGQPYNYADVVLQAVKSAPRRQAFVTELAAPTRQLKASVFPPTRFGDLDALAKITDVAGYLEFLRSNDYTFNAALVAILARYIPQPPELHLLNGRQPPQQPSPANYYYNFAQWSAWNPEIFGGDGGTRYTVLDPSAITAEIAAKIVKPVRDAAFLFDGSPYLTRLFTRIDPADMNRDPVFGFNPFLPDVSNRHEATLFEDCDGNGAARSRFKTADGYEWSVPSWGIPTPPNVPAARRIEILREGGPTEVVTDNDAAIRAVLASGGGGGPSPNPGALDLGLNHASRDDSAFCSLRPGRAAAGSALMALALLAIVSLLVRRGRRR